MDGTSCDEGMWMVCRLVYCFFISACNWYIYSSVVFDPLVKVVWCDCVICDNLFDLSIFLLENFQCHQCAALSPLGLRYFVSMCMDYCSESLRAGLNTVLIWSVLNCWGCGIHSWVYMGTLWYIYPASVLRRVTVSSYSLHFIYLHVQHGCRR